MNTAMALAGGAFLTHLDDDDEMHPDAIAVLLDHVRSTRAEFVFHPFWHQNGDGSWTLNPADSFALGKVSTGSVFYHHWFRQIGWDPFAYRYGEPGDWNRFRRIQDSGARIERVDRALLRHFKERNQGSTDVAGAIPAWDVG